MTKPSDHDNEQQLLEALNTAWTQMDDTFKTEPAPLADWTSMVRDRRRIAKRRLWRELALLWALAIPLLGVMFLLISGMQTVFWLLEAAVTAAFVPLLIGEFRGAAGGSRGGSFR